MKRGFLRASFVGMVAGLFALQSLAAKPPPPFGDSITWATDKEAPSLEAMRGKSVLVLFFQDWCGICNGWSPGLFRQIGDAYADDPRVVLVAIKTDGGSLKEALAYLESRTETDRWLVGVDENATYYRQATGDDKLYKYMWITPEGSVGKIEKAGTYVSGSDPKEFTLATERSRTEYRKGAVPLMPTDPPLDEALKPAIRQAERGLFLTALESVAKLSAGASLKEDVATFRKRIAAHLETSVERYAEAVADEDNQDRYLAFLALSKIGEDFGKSGSGQAARKAAAEHASSSWVDAEEEAADDYQSIMRRAARADDERSRARIAKALAKLAEEYPETLYGRIAASSLK